MKNKTAMIYPYESSEKAISNYSSTLAKGIKESFPLHKINYHAGRPLDVFKVIKKTRKFKKVHFQHEYNLMGGYSLPIFLLYYYFLFSGKEVITTMHNVLSKKEKLKGSKLKSKLRKILYSSQNSLISLVSQKVIVHSKCFKNILMKDYGVWKEDIEVIPQAVCPERFSKDKENLKKKYGLKGPIYLLIGSLIPDHGADIILSQADKIGKTILVVGSDTAINDRNQERMDDWKNYLFEIVEKNNYEDFVKFNIGKIDYKEWFDYLNMADLVILPYKGGIGSGIFADALSTKTPMICSNIPFFKDALKDYSFLRIAKSNKYYPKEIKEAMKKRNYNKMLKSLEKYRWNSRKGEISLKYNSLYLK